jgi:hypothetical protein
MSFLMFSHYFVGILNNSFPFQGMSDLARPDEDPTNITDVGASDSTADSNDNEDIAAPAEDPTDFTDVGVGDSTANSNDDSRAIINEGQTISGVACQTEEVACHTCGMPPFLAQVCL